MNIKISLPLKKMCLKNPTLGNSNFPIFIDVIYMVNVMINEIIANCDTFYHKKILNNIGCCIVSLIEWLVDTRLLYLIVLAIIKTTHYCSACL
jgi:hypothetical protein